MAKNVTKIPATISQYTAAPITNRPKRKVAGYARVSTDHDEQLTSYEAQLDYYTALIKGHEDWAFAGMYSDEGITGTSTKKREGFQRMVADRPHHHKERQPFRSEHGRFSFYHPQIEGTWH